ncbi:AAA family ATPase [Candidatus Poribacteria bacterium]
MGFKSLKINNWKQFDAIDIEFHDRLTILTGANASGKTIMPPPSWPSFIKGKGGGAVSLPFRITAHLIKKC